MHFFSLPCVPIQKLLIWFFFPIVTGSSRQGTLTGSLSQVQCVVCITCWPRRRGIPGRRGDFLPTVERALDNVAVVGVNRLGGDVRPGIRVAIGDAVRAGGRCASRQHQHQRK